MSISIIVAIGVFLIGYTAVFVIGGMEVVRDCRNPLPKFDDYNGDENRSVTFKKTRSIIYQEL